MRKFTFLVLALILAAALAGCDAKEPKEAAAVPESESEETADEPGEVPGNESEETADEPERTQEFTSLDLTIKEGTLNIVSGDAFSLTCHDGDITDYEIIDGTLHFKNGHVKDVLLTLPAEEEYDTLTLDIKEGHVYVEETMYIRTLNLTGERSEVTAESLNVEKSSSILLEEGSGFLAGDLGYSVTADCRQGHLNMALSLKKEEYDYEIEMREGNIQVGGENFHGRTVSRTIDNGGDRTMKLSCSRGDISVEF